MDNVLVFVTVNINLTLAYRMLQGTSPLKIRLDRIRHYDPPFGTSLKCLKIFFSSLIIYMGLPVSLLWGRYIFTLYLVYWFLTIWWWKFFSLCMFTKCLYISSTATVMLIASMSYFFHSHKLFMYTWMPPLWWSAYTLYISIWYKHAYAKTNFILS